MQRHQEGVPVVRHERIVQNIVMAVVQSVLRKLSELTSSQTPLPGSDQSGLHDHPSQRLSAAGEQEINL